MPHEDRVCAQIPRGIVLNVKDETFIPGRMPKINFDIFNQHCWVADMNRGAMGVFSLERAHHAWSATPSGTRAWSIHAEAMLGTADTGRCHSVMSLAGGGLASSTAIPTARCWRVERVRLRRARVGSG